MRNSVRESDIHDPEALLYRSLDPVIRGMGMDLIELSLFFQKGRRGRAADARRKDSSPVWNSGTPGRDRPGAVPSSGTVKVRAVILKTGVTGVEDCSRVHRSIMPRLELAFPGQEIYLEVSSPGIDRIIKDGREFAHYTGRSVKCYLTDISGWTDGFLVSADEDKIILRRENGDIAIPYEIIGKARLNDA